MTQLEVMAQSVAAIAPATSTVGIIVLFVIAAVGAATFATIGIKMSTRLGLVLEIVSVAAGLVVLACNGITSGPSQHSFEGATFDGVTFVIVIAVLGFVGFESAASLGAEARNRTGRSPARSWAAR